MLAALAAVPSLPAQANPTVEQRLAAAKLAETRGDLATAEAELRAALGASAGGDRERVDAELRAVLARQGRAEGAPAAGGDPVQRLIATLEQGSSGQPQVGAAIVELEALGPLAVPPLLAALPQLGPFGLANALHVLQRRDDPRIATALLQRLDDADAATAEAIASRLVDLAPAVALPVANELARRDGPPPTTFAAFRALVRHGGDPELLRTMAARLAQEPAVEQPLLDALDAVDRTWALDALVALAANGSDTARLQALVRWFELQPELTEAEALARVAELPPAKRPHAARHLAGEHRDWVRAAVLGLEVLDPDAFRDPRMAAVEWWREPAIAAPALLEFAIDNRSSRPGFGAVATDVLSRLASMVDAGWTTPAGLDEQLLQVVQQSTDPNRFHTLVRALPVGAEDRALAMFGRFGRNDRGLFANAVVQAERPWHRVIARRLQAATSAGEIANDFVARDWSGAPPAAIDALVAFAARFAVDGNGQFPAWQQPLIGVWRRSPELPAAVILPFVAAGNMDAWRALAAREPDQALAHARATPSLSLTTHPQLDWLLRRHGTAADVPLAVRLLQADWHSDPSGVRTFLERFGTGRADVIALARGEDADGPAQVRFQVAARAAAGADVAQLRELLAVLPQLPWGLVRELGSVIEPQLRTEHGPLLAAAVERELAGAAADRRELGVLLQWLAATQDPNALPAVRRVLADPEVGDGVAASAAAAALAVAGAERPAVIAELLASPRPEVVGAALTAPELRGDARLRELAREAVRRLVDRIAIGDGAFDALAAPDATALAAVVLASERFPAVPQGTAIAALRALRRSPPDHAMLARGAAHPDPFVRAAAAEELGNTFTREAAPFLLELLKDRSDDVRKQAQRSLEQLASYLDAKEQWEKRLK